MTCWGSCWPNISWLEKFNMKNHNFPLFFSLTLSHSVDEEIVSRLRFCKNVAIFWRIIAREISLFSRTNYRSNSDISLSQISFSQLPFQNSKKKRKTVCQPLQLFTVLNCFFFLFSRGFMANWYVSSSTFLFFFYLFELVPNGYKVRVCKFNKLFYIERNRLFTFSLTPSCLSYITL